MSESTIRDLTFWPNRTICSILEDMRKMHDTHNYSQLQACIEELQYAANRMEAALEDNKEINRIRETLADMKLKYKKMKKKLKEVE